ncbi:MAG: phosphoglycerate dehydrogenase [Deltaproteobacteria bacterium]|nr:phosphoglycerate dehydrogenase [Deltaproteobacteria bacterium]
MTDTKPELPSPPQSHPHKTMRVCSLGPTFGSHAPQPAQWLRDKGWEVVIRPRGFKVTPETVKEFLKDCDGMIPGMTKIDGDIMRALPRLKVIAVHGVGVDHIDVQAAEELGIAVCNVPGGNALSVAEFTIGLLFALARQIPQADRLVKQGGWHPVVGCRLGGRTLGIVGLGQIGKEVAIMAKCLGMKLMACGRTHDREFTGRHGISWVSLEELLAESDFVSLHLPGTPETKGVIQAPQLAMMKPGAYLLNLGRGELINEADLLESLQSGHLAGAALDVFCEEPVGDNPLAKLPQVIATPHNASFTVEVAYEVGFLCVRNLAAVLEGRMPPNLVNRWKPPQGQPGE